MITLIDLVTILTLLKGKSAFWILIQYLILLFIQKQLPQTITSNNFKFVVLVEFSCKANWAKKNSKGRCLWLRCLWLLFQCIYWLLAYSSFLFLLVSILVLTHVLINSFISKKPLYSERDIAFTKRNGWLVRLFVILHSVSCTSSMWTLLVQYRFRSSSMRGKA